MIKKILSKIIRKDNFLDQKVLFVSYPKSGRTWMRVILHDLGFNPKFTHAGATYYNLESNYEDIKNYKNNKIVFISRDPRDTVVSYYYHLKYRLNEYEGTLEEFMSDKKYGIEVICTFNAAWLKNASLFAGFIHIRYEDMKYHPLDTMTALLNFLGKDRNANVVKKVLKNNEFDKMQSKEKNGILAKKFPNRFASTGEKDANSFKVRKGQVGGYKEEMNLANLSYCNTLMSKYGYITDDYNSLKLYKELSDE